ncbi:hypothetical protein TorRG33x02_116690 [Trema orientale]|uniref:Uncharacterized protein n=1 Tax=Trema orientale TaxID=63057 RepID=A0A2P5F462_TREOI|nr:hypothetical protein TorRG33x02_116690 [Trema orientale]
MDGRHPHSTHWRWPHPSSSSSPSSSSQSVNPNFPIQNSTNLYYQNLAFQPQNFPHQQQWQQQSHSPGFPPTYPVQNPGFHAPAFQFQSPPRNLIDEVDKAVEKARRDFIAGGRTVTAWQVAQAALLALQIDSWSSLGFRMQEVPSLYNIILVEGKINAYINCYVAVRRITSLYDLETAICKHEGVNQFEDLGLGPLVRHPLVLHYFSLKLETTQVFKITSKEIMLLLYDYTLNSKNRDVKVEEFLDFIAKKRSVSGKEELGIRIQSLGYVAHSPLLLFLDQPAADEISVAGHFPEPLPFGWAPKGDVGARTHDLTLPK